MILVDTSVWIEHLRGAESRLADLLNGGAVLIHQFIIEELACGNITNREEILALIHSLPRAPLADHPEILEFIAGERLHGTGLSAVDVHLLASARLARARIWSHDKVLARAARKLELSSERR